MAELKPCLCGEEPVVDVGYDTLRIYCPHCGLSTETVVGDYYDEGFMFAIYGETLTEDWNRRADNG